MTPAQKKLIQSLQDITSLCDAAIVAYSKAADNSKSKAFTWRGNRFKATWSIYCIYANDMHGNPIPQRVW